MTPSLKPHHLNRLNELAQWASGELPDSDYRGPADRPRDTISYLLGLIDRLMDQEDEHATVRPCCGRDTDGDGNCRVHFDSNIPREEAERYLRDNERVQSKTLQERILMSALIDARHDLQRAERRRKDLEQERDQLRSETRTLKQDREHAGIVIEQLKTVEADLTAARRERDQVTSEHTTLLRELAEVFYPDKAGHTWNSVRAVTNAVKDLNRERLNMEMQRNRLKEWRDEEVDGLKRMKAALDRVRPSTFSVVERVEELTRAVIANRPTLLTTTQLYTILRDIDNTLGLDPEGHPDVTLAEIRRLKELETKVDSEYNLQQAKAALVHDRQDGVVYAYVCDLCGQLLSNEHSTCNSGLHSPNMGNPVTTYDLVKQQHSPARAKASDEVARAVIEWLKVTPRPVAARRVTHELYEAAIRLRDIIKAESPDYIPMIRPTDTPPRGTCTHPPAGWWCSFPEGHEGPCAAREVAEQPSPLTYDDIEQDKGTGWYRVIGTPCATKDTARKLVDVFNKGWKAGMAGQRIHDELTAQVEQHFIGQPEPLEDWIERIGMAVGVYRKFPGSDRPDK